ncbi:MAG TPA: glycosyltransferase family 2 protein [Candidatus Lokiarchaeia archaeon]|nr:glycosyltransferase family 2 protein [Candidatus Lokiarchaeia archaeon]
MVVEINDNSNVDFSIIIPVFNSEKTIKQCLEAILDSKFNGNREIIVIDDGSTDDSIDLIKDLPIKIIYQENKGSAAAKNLGAKNAQGNFLVFVDSDVLIMPDTLTRIFDIIKNEKYHYIATRYSEYPANNAFIHKYKALHDYYFFYHMFYSIAKNDDIEYAPVPLNGGVEVYKKQTFLELHGYDESIKGAGVEREELFTRLKQKYYYVWNSEIVTQHYFPDFCQLTRNFFKRTQGTFQLIKDKDYFPENFKKLSTMVIIAPIGLLSFLLSAVFTVLLFQLVNYYLFIIPAIMFACYIIINRGFFGMAYRKQGLSFMIYTLIIHGFFSNIIALSGFLSALKRNKPGKP